MTESCRSPELYDLKTDPYEKQNIRNQRAELTALMVMRLLKELRKFQFIEPEEQAAPLSSDDRKSLRALGYLD